MNSDGRVGVKKSKGVGFGWLVAAMLLIIGFAAYQNRLVRMPGESVDGSVQPNEAGNNGPVIALAPHETPMDGGEESEATDVRGGSNAEYIGAWEGSLGGLIQVRFKFKEDYSSEILFGIEDQIETTYKILPDGGFKMLYDQGGQSIEGSISYGEKGTYIDFCHHYGLKSKPGESAIFGPARGKECGSAVMR